MSSNQPEDLVITPIPPLVAVLLNMEQAKGSALNEVEVLKARDAAACIALPIDAHAKLVKSRGYKDIDPENVWEEWLAFKASHKGGPIQL